MLLNQNFCNTRAIGILVHFVVAMNEHNYVGILLKRVMYEEVACHKVMSVRHGSIEHFFNAERCYRNNLVPADVRFGDVLQLLTRQSFGETCEAGARNARGEQRLAVVCHAHGRSNRSPAHARCFFCGRDEKLPRLFRQGVYIDVVGDSTERALQVFDN